jgi:tetratricopeptide (TPR) repeat protein
MAAYDAFISYSHAKDRAIAAALQSVVQTLGKPWYRRRALRVFRDDTSLSATPGLWPSIEDALARSRYLILLASPEAAASPWVDKEVATWLATKGGDTLLIALTDGDIFWDDASSDFGWRGERPLPAALRGGFAQEPKWVDLRPYRAGASPSDTRFLELGADLAAAVHGMPKEDLLSQEVRQQRRALTLAWSAVGSLVVLAGAAGWQWRAAVTAERVAVEQRLRAEAALARAQVLLTGTSKSTAIVGEMFDAGNLPTAVARQIVEVLRSTYTELAHNRVDPSVAPAQLRAMDMLARSHFAVGDIKAALHVAMAQRELATGLAKLDAANDDWQQLLADAHKRIGIALRRQGRTADALAAFEANKTVVARLVRDLPDDRARRRELAIILEIISDTLRAQGNLAGAYAENNASLALYEALGSRWDVANSRLRAGDIHWDQGNLELALAAFREALAITAEPAADPTPRVEPERNWKWSAALAYLRIGNALRIGGDLDGALEHYRDYTRLADQMEARDPRNEVWLRHKSRSRAMTGDMLFAKGAFMAARSDYEGAQAIARALLRRDAGNRLAQQELLESYRRFGDVALAQGQPVEAIEQFRAATRHAEQLTGADRSNVLWQEDLAIARERTGDALAAAGDTSAALSAYRAALTVSEALIAGRRVERPTWRHNLARAHARIGAMLAAQGEVKEARAAFEACLVVPVSAVSFDLRNSMPRDVLADCRARLARLEARTDLPAPVAAQEGAPRAPMP